MNSTNNPLNPLRKNLIRKKLIAACAISIVLFVVVSGCGTTTTRIATEQLLMSDAVDQAIAKIDFGHLEGRKVYLDTLFLHSVSGVGFVNSEYIISSLRQQLTAANCQLQDSRDKAEIIVEPRVGALGTDGHEVVYGIPQSGAVNSAAAIISSTPVPSIPEISIGKSNAQSGIAKIIVYAYDSKTRMPVWQSGIAKAESTSKDTWFLGAGPFQKGSIYEGMRFAGNRFPRKMAQQHQPPTQQSAETGVGYQDEYVFEQSPQQTDLPSGETSIAAAKGAEKSTAKTTQPPAQPKSLENSSAGTSGQRDKLADKNVSTATYETAVGGE